jgi:co-chaperonin GroES (HSP10)
MKSLYFDRFSKIDKDVLAPVQNDLILVEKLELEVKRSSGIILADSSSDPRETALGGSKTDFYIVLETGEGYTNDQGIIDKNDPQCKLPVERGNIIAIPAFSVQWFKTIPPLKDYNPFSIGICKANEVRLKFVNMHSFEDYFTKLNGG